MGDAKIGKKEILTDTLNFISFKLSAKAKRRFTAVQKIFS